MNDDDDEKQKQKDLFGEARKRRDLGMERIADSVGPEWMARAGDLFVEYGRRVANGKPFLSEDASPWAHAQGLPVPRKGQSWGPVVIRLRKTGRIRHVGYGPARTSNLGPKNLWAVP